jgi:Ser/Thr protein kinase RdoA (MazF antagonist)
LASLEVPVPRPVGATFATPGSLRRWLPITETAVRHDLEATSIAQLLRELVTRLRRQWVPAAQLPVQLTHGDVRLGNVCRPQREAAVHTGDPKEGTVYFDFGFAAVRPRVHDLAHSLAFMVWALDCLEAPERFPWQNVPRLIEAYEEASATRLTAAERRALVPYTAAVLLVYAALDGFTADPTGKLRTRVPFLRLSEWLLKRSYPPWS